MKMGGAGFGTSVRVTPEIPIGIPSPSMRAHSCLGRESTHDKVLIRRIKRHTTASLPCGQSYPLGLSGCVRRESGALLNWQSELRVTVTDAYVSARSTATRQTLHIGLMLICPFN
ncbi:Uncharacterised protein [Corynebacterium renale]|uniref:Uncharacterized protein n=1 Tax=Corynebacterium renale TaxID=1724 RepID=A0A2A9DP01_9CORY|nr:hypothetical protein ATK06_1430 [Corynebacterium renale]SQI19005.1 Uncharacterised protein [Corynebacterium renale]